MAGEDRGCESLSFPAKEPTKQPFSKRLFSKQVFSNFDI
jgi:hypothetical protein